MLDDLLSGALAFIDIVSNDRRDWLGAAFTRPTIIVARVILSIDTA